MKTIQRIDTPPIKNKKWSHVPFMLKYRSYIHFFLFWQQFGIFFIWIFAALTKKTQLQGYLFLCAAAITIYNIYTFSNWANLKRARREYMRWLVIERLDNKFWQCIWIEIAFFIILTKGQYRISIEQISVRKR